MRYRTFKGKSKQEAFAQLNLEKQNDPDLKEARLIKHSEEQTSSFMGLKKETIYEIVVGIPEYTIPQKNPSEKSTAKQIPQNKKLSFYADTSKFSHIEKEVIKKKTTSIQDTLFALENVSRVAEQISKLEQTQKNENRLKINTNKKQVLKKDPEFEHLKNELSGIRNEFQTMQELLLSHIQKTKTTTFQNQVLEEIEGEKSLPDEYEIHKQHIRWIEQYLKDREFSSFLIEDLIVEFQKTPELLKNKKEILKAVKEFLISNIPNNNINLDNYQFGKNVILVGTTGVGKTSTIVKLAAHVALMRKKSFRFISIDRYKVGGETQLEKLAGYMKAEFHSINKQEEFFTLLNDNSMDFTFIDTAGKSPKDSIAIQELANWINIIQYPIDIHLVVSATTKIIDLEYICDAYSIFSYNHILVTKLDETKTYGSVLSIAYKYKKALSFLTDGQEIPQDFAIADMNRFISDSLA